MALLEDISVKFEQPLLCVCDANPYSTLPFGYPPGRNLGTCRSMSTRQQRDLGRIRRSGITHHFFFLSLHFVLISSSVRRNETAAAAFLCQPVCAGMPAIESRTLRVLPPIDTEHHVALEPDEIYRAHNYNNNDMPVNQP